MFRILSLGHCSLQAVRTDWRISTRSLSYTAPCLRTPKKTQRSRKAKLAPVFNVKIPSKSIVKDYYWLEKNLKIKLHTFTSNAEIKRKASGLGIRGGLFSRVSNAFVKAALEGKLPRINARTLYNSFNEDEGQGYIDKVLLSEFFTYAEPHLPSEIVDRFNSLRKISDLRFPSEWFPDARQMKRKIILHVGPTNSGKTYRALKRLESAESGIYCGPLRLLAHEIFEKMNEKGIPCNLLTGEERREVMPYAPLTSSTVEMASLNKTMDVAVIDEIQMISDPDRGWAWTQALLGLKAKEIHLCGEASAVPLVKKICESLDEEVEVNEYSRLTPYEVLNKSLVNDLSMIRKGDCVVAFSRNDIFNLKKKIELLTGLHCAVAYGALPPETRALQAKAFNDPNSGFDVMVASDAIGMGLNLNIKRIVFSTVQKYDGNSFNYISVPQLKQIAGRAGRFGTAYDKGEVTTLHPHDLAYIKECVNAPIIPLEMAGLQPTVEILELFALQMPNEKFSGLLQKFEDLASLNGDYFLCNYRDQKAIADFLEHIKLPLRDRYQFVTAPVSVRNEASTLMIQELAEKFSKGETCALDDVIQLPNSAPSTPKELIELENSHKNIMLYMWLSLRYPETFITTQEYASEMKIRCEVMIDDVLKNTAFGSKAKRKHTINNDTTKKQKV
ncbi:P-loop containing nucleoside triphosphate hydrolase protein [Cokeromyces recurvatus]|uniref:P-loop containing nucleoside triphosphate hydrolase protein n=1 Tax=Cokeromyces recurvatus TaxID=90255 RepID=UPI00221E8555|nr:P-loop containing nucleoside triphosphate hydrolase protein [Cokeromyces recurvatus]KAI7904750.1 P-loop containing nucleoside triphosphate hydrolase protein [Cokeromyces recurvatus]